MKRWEKKLTGEISLLWKEREGGRDSRIIVARVVARRQNPTLARSDNFAIENDGHSAPDLMCLALENPDDYGDSAHGLLGSPVRVTVTVELD